MVRVFVSLPCRFDLHDVEVGGVCLLRWLASSLMVGHACKPHRILASALHAWSLVWWPRTVSLMSVGCSIEALLGNFLKTNTTETR